MFGGKYHQEIAKSGISDRASRFRNFLGAPLKTNAFGDSQLPRLSETSGYGPDTDFFFSFLSGSLHRGCKLRTLRLLLRGS